MPLAYLGGIKSLANAEQAMAEGFDCVVMARALLHDPALVNKFRSGETWQSGCDKLQRLRRLYLPSRGYPLRGKPAERSGAQPGARRSGGLRQEGEARRLAGDWRRTPAARRAGSCPARPCASGAGQQLFLRCRLLRGRLLRGRLLRCSLFHRRLLRCRLSWRQASSLRPFSPPASSLPRVSSLLQASSPRPFSQPVSSLLRVSWLRPSWLQASSPVSSLPSVVSRC